MLLEQSHSALMRDLKTSEASAKTVLGVSWWKLSSRPSLHLFLPIISPLLFSYIYNSAHRFHPGCHPHPWHKSFRGQRCTQRPIYYQTECKVSYRGKWSLHWSGRYRERENREGIYVTLEVVTSQYVWSVSVEVGSGQEVLLASVEAS